MTSLQLGGPMIPNSTAAGGPMGGNWASQLGGMQPVGPPAGLVNPFMAGPPMVHAGVPASNTYSLGSGAGMAGGGLFSTAGVGQQDLNPQWSLLGNTSAPLSQPSTVAATSNLWQ